MPPNSLTRDGQVAEPVAATQRSFPKAVIEPGQIAPNLNRTFAAQVPSVSHADTTAINPFNLEVGFANENCLAKS